MLVIDVSFLFLFLFYFIYCISIPYSHDNDQNLTYNVNKFILEDLAVMHEIVFPLCQHVEIYLLLLNLYCTCTVWYLHWQNCPSLPIIFPCFESCGVWIFRCSRPEYSWKIARWTLNNYQSINVWYLL